MKRINKKLLTACILSAMLIMALSIIILMLYPLYCDHIGTRTDVLQIYTITIGGEEIDYCKIDSVENGGLISALIKGDRSSATDALEICNIYCWKAAPDGDTEYLLIEHNEEYSEIRRSENPNYKNPLIIIKRMKSSDHVSTDAGGAR